MHNTLLLTGVRVRTHVRGVHAIILKTPFNLMAWDQTPSVIAQNHQFHTTTYSVDMHADLFRSMFKASANTLQNTPPLAVCLHAHLHPH